LGEIFKNASNVDVVIDSIATIDSSNQTIKGETEREYSYDKLVLALGNEKYFYGIEGLDHFAHTMYTIRDTMALRSALVEAFTRAHRHKVRVIVIGGGASGVELCGDLHTFNEMVAKRYGTRKKELRVDLIEGSPRILPLLKEEASKKATARLEKIGVRVMTNKKVLRCSQNSVRLDDTELAADIIVWTAGSRSSSMYAQFPDMFELDEKGRVKVNQYLQSDTSHKIFVLGDNASTTYSGMAQTAIYDAIFVANNFLRGSRGLEYMEYSPKEPIYVCPIGPKWAVLQDKGKVTSGLKGWVVRRRADLWIFKNFQPYADAIKTWRKGNKLARF